MGKPFLDLWFPYAFKGKGRPLFRTVPRNKDVPFHIHEVPDPDSETGFKSLKHYSLRSLRPMAYGSTTKEFEDIIKSETETQIAAARDFQILRGAVSVDWCAYYEPPLQPKHNRMAKVMGEVAYLKKPDKDNIEKLLKDALNTLAYTDDVQVVFGTGAKIYSEREGLRALVKEIDPLEVKAWADRTFKWDDQEFKLEAG